MLVQFSVSNFLSFNEEQVFNLGATATDQNHPEHVNVGEATKGGPVLRAAAIYGPNASGKSNLVEAIRFAQDLILTGTRSNREFAVRRFKLSAANASLPSKFEFVLRTQGDLYDYGFRITSTRVVDEWLYATRDKKELLLFARETTADGNVHVDFGAELRQRIRPQEQFLQFVAQGTRPNQLFLTEAADRNVGKVRPVVDWFENMLTIISAEPRTHALEIQISHDKSLSECLSMYLRAAGTGVINVECDRVPVDVTTLFPDMPQKQRSDLIASLQALQRDHAVMVEAPGGVKHHFDRNDSGDPVRVELKLNHRGTGGETVPFTLAEESDGTQRFVNLIPALFMLQSAGSEKVIVIDELDRRFHPHLTRLFVEAALRGAAENPSSQLIFTTHDTNLLDLDILRRDEIWFVEKNKDGASRIYSLPEFKVRPDLKIEKGYLNGRFGAIPFITPIEDLGWTEKSSDAFDELYPVAAMAQ